MILRKHAKYESRRQILYELSKKIELQDLTKIILIILTKAIEFLGDDPILKGQKLMKMIQIRDTMIQKKQQENLEYIYTIQILFSLKFIQFLRVNNQNFEINYCNDLERVLLKYDQEKLEKTEAYNQIKQSSDQTLIQIHLVGIKHRITNQQECQFISTHPKIINLLKNCILIVNNQNKIIREKYIINSKSLSRIYINYFQILVKYIRPKQEKYKKLIFRALIQLLLYKNILILELIRFIKLIRNSQVYNVYYSFGMIEVKPTLKFLEQMSYTPQFSSQVGLLKINYVNLNSKLPKQEQYYRLVQAHLPYTQIELLQIIQRNQFKIIMVILLFLKKFIQIQNFNKCFNQQMKFLEYKLN